MSFNIGIDFGSTYSLAAHLNSKGDPEIIPDPRQPSGNGLVPSAVSIREDGSVAVGWEARELFRLHPERTILSVKRMIAGGATQKISLGEESFSPEQLISFILKRLKENAEKIVEDTVSKAVISAPSHFDVSQHNLILHAAGLAGFSESNIITDAEAAIAAHGRMKHQNGLFAVYDLGGRMFGISIIRVENANPKLLAAAGDSSLGGDDMDQRIAEKILKEIANQHGGRWQSDPYLAAQILKESERAKCAVSHRGSYDFHIVDEKRGIQYQRAFSRYELADVTRDIVDRTIELCERAMKEAGLTPEQIDEVLLVGGATRMPLVHEVAGKIFKRKCVSHSHPDQVVAMGAAIRAKAWSPAA